MAGGGVVLIGLQLIPLLSGLFGVRAAGGVSRCTYAIAPSLLWITALSIIGSELQTNIHPSMKGGVLCSFDTTLIFLLNLRKTLINHFS